MKNKRQIIFLALAASLLMGSCNIFHKDSSSLPSSEDDSSSSILPSVDPDALYGGYYSSLTTWDNGQDLIKKLHDIISGGTYQPIQYVGSYTNWSSNQDADRDIYDREYLDVIYSGDKIVPSSTNTSWQREHAWPASLMTGKTTGEAVKTVGRATDFHNLFAASTNGNTSRGNKNYGKANTTSASFTDKNYSNGGYRYDEKNFEPADKDKGRVSRAIFYMATMYSEDEYDESGVLLYKGLKVQEDYVDYAQGSYDAYAIGNLSDLLDWSKTAVDYLEYQHNESVYSYVPGTHNDVSKNTAQGNRNPYVDFPGLVEYAFGDKKNTAGSLSDLLSSYEALKIGKPEKNIRTIISAKRVYNVGDAFSKADVVIGKYDADMAISNDSNFTIKDVTDGEVLNTIGTRTVTIDTENNQLTYTFEIKEDDPFVSSTYTYTLIGKSSGGDLVSIADNPGVDNEVTLNGVTWIFRYEKGAIKNRDKTKGVAFGTGSVPVESLTIRSKDSFSFAGKSLVESIYLKGSAGSGCSYTCAMYVGNTFLKQAALGYDADAPKEISASLSTPQEGAVKFVITNITKAVYIHSLAVNLQ